MGAPRLTTKGNEMTTATQYQQAAKRLQELANAEQNELVADVLRRQASEMAIKFADALLEALAQ